MCSLRNNNNVKKVNIINEIILFIEREKKQQLIVLIVQYNNDINNYRGRCTGKILLAFCFSREFIMYQKHLQYNILLTLRGLLCSLAIICIYF